MWARRAPAGSETRRAYGLTHGAVTRHHRIGSMSPQWYCCSASDGQPSNLWKHDASSASAGTHPADSGQSGARQLCWHSQIGSSPGAAGCSEAEAAAGGAGGGAGGGSSKSPQ